MSQHILLHDLRASGIAAVTVDPAALSAADPNGFGKRATKVNDLVKRLDQRIAERGKLREQVYGPPVPTVRRHESSGVDLSFINPRPVRQIDPPNHKRTSLEADVAAVLEGQDLPQQEQHEAAKKRLADLDREIEALEGAIRIERTRLDVDRRRASKVICSEKKAAYDELATQVVLSLISAHQATTAVRRLTSRLEADGVIWRPDLHHVDVEPVLGRLNDKSSDLASLLREAVKAGLIGERDLPTELQR